MRAGVRRTKPVNVQIEGPADFYAKFVLARATASETRSEESARARARVIAREHIRRPIVSQSPLRPDDRMPDFTSGCDATRAALPNGKRAAASLLREIHSAREIAPRTKRNGSRRFYYTALKPGGLPLQSYRSKLGALYNADNANHSL